MLIRFFDLKYAPFVGDEPTLQYILGEHIKKGEFPLFGLVGSHGVLYGPTAMWFFYPVRLLTNNVNLIIAFCTTLFMIAFLLIYFSARIQVGRKAAAWTLLLLSVSPYLFLYSRSAWDNPFQIFTSALAIFFLCLAQKEIENHPRTRTKQLVLYSIMGGFGAGLCFNSHLMSIPFIASIGLLYIGFIVSGRLYRALQVKSFASFTVGFLMVSGHYLSLIAPTLVGGGRFKFTTEALTHQVPGTFLSSTLYMSNHYMGYFMDGSLKPIRKTMGFLPGLFIEADPGWILKIIAWGMIFLTFSYWARSRSISYLEKLGITLFGMIIFYYYGVRPIMGQPHYFMPVWWVGFLFVGIGLQRLSNTRLKTASRFIALFAVLINTYFVISFHKYIKSRSGTQRIHYGTVHTEIKNAVEDVCHKMIQNGDTRVIIDMTETPGLDHASLRYFFTNLEHCQNKEVIYTSPIYGGNYPEGHWYELAYINPDSAKFTFNSTTPKEDR